MALTRGEKDRKKVLAIHQHFWQAYADRDLDRRFAVCAPDVTFIGTGRHERAVGIAEYRAMNQKGVDQFPRPFSISFQWTLVHLHGDMAWVECSSLWNKPGQDASCPEEIRLTTILARTSGKWLVHHVHGSVPDYRLHEGEFMMHDDLRRRNQELERIVAERTRELQFTKDAADDLLRNILPATAVDELQATGRVKARLYRNVTVLFADFKDFTRHSERMRPEALVDALNDHFAAFDELLIHYRVEKIKTMGDAYLIAAGLPIEDDDHACEAVDFALAMRDLVRERRTQGRPHSFGMRIGLHSGEVVAGIVGLRKFAYDIWGDTVNTAARLQEACPEDHVNISATTYALVKNRFTCLYRGQIEAKHKGPMRMYLVGSRRSIAPGTPRSPLSPIDPSLLGMTRSRR